MCQSLFVNKVADLRPQACNFIKKEALTQVFSCEFCKIFKNTYFYRTPLVATSECNKKSLGNNTLFTFKQPQVSAI